MSSDWGCHTWTPGETLSRAAAAFHLVFHWPVWPARPVFSIPGEPASWHYLLLSWLKYKHVLTNKCQLAKERRWCGGEWCLGQSETPTSNAEIHKRLCLNEKTGRTQAVCSQASVTLHLQCGWDPLTRTQPNSLCPFLSDPYSLPPQIYFTSRMSLFILCHLQRQLEYTERHEIALYFFISKYN